MTHLRSSTVILGVIFLFISNDSNATITCARLKSVSAGEMHTLALADDNSLFACGDNSVWELGIGDRFGQVSTLRQVKVQNGIGYLKNIVSYDAGWKHSLAAGADGNVWSLGWDDFGQLGNGAGQQNNEFPDKVKDINGTGFLNHIVYVSAGRSGEHSLAVDSNGYVYAWEKNLSGQCGDGSYTQRDIPVLVLDDNPLTQKKYLGDVAHIIKVDAGIIHSLALDSNGHVWH
jgi:alpha-tubulin suppressor-like RCC1 family protein